MFNKPPPPIRIQPSSTWPHISLWNAVQDALRALPAYFDTKTSIEGMLATDIHTLNAALSATIEEQVVGTLNTMRAVWDPGKSYQTYSFERQSQTFPDVRLRRRQNGQDIIMGLELKGWYLLAKEGMPNFRFTATSAACAQADLIVVVPWALSNILAGTPVVFPPYIELAKYAAEQRNYYWQHLRETKNNTSIIIPKGVQPYPAKRDQISDKAQADSGTNFGRMARYGIMDKYIREAMAIKFRGITAKDWLEFFKVHNETTD